MVVGHVVEGLDAIESLSKVYCYKGVPLDPVVIKYCGVVDASWVLFFYGVFVQEMFVLFSANE